MNKILKLLLITFVSVVGIYLAFKGENLQEIILQIKQVDFIGFWVACFIITVSCIVRAYRWQLLMNPVEHIPLYHVFSATMIGYFGNGVLAFRLGELLRAYSVTSNRNMSTSQAFGTVILERILDMLTVVLIFIFTIPWFPFEHEAIRFAIIIFSGVSLFLIIAIFIASQLRMMDYIKTKNYFQSGVGQKLVSIIEKIFDGIVLIKKTNHFGLILFTSVLLWSFYYVVTYIVLEACCISLGVVGTGILLVLGSVAIGIPALPGSAGTYEAGVKFSLMVVFSISGDIALSYAIVSHAVSYFPLTIIGAIFFIFGNVSLKDVKQGTAG